MPQILNNKNMKKYFFALIYLLFSGAISAQDITFCGYDNSGSKVVLPVELRIGHVFRQKWYVMADLVYGVSLANETQYLEPTIRVGYNFGLRKKSNYTKNNIANKN